MNKRLSIIVLVLLATLSAAAQQELPPIRNFVRVNDQFCTGAQPRLEHLEKLKAEGVKAIINLRTRGEHRADEEEAKAKELGLRYFNIPVVFGEPKEEQATEFLKITDDPENRPAFIHCAGAVRVGAFWMIRRVLRDGWTVERAEEEAEKIGLLAALPSVCLGQTGRKAPPLVLKDLRGRTLRLSDYKGKVVLLNFWATWCPPCGAEMPDLIKLQREYRSKGLRVIGVTYPPEEIKEVRQFIRKLRVNYPVALGTKETKTLFDETETLPLTVVIDREGNVRERIEGILLPEEFEQRIKPLLK